MSNIELKNANLGALDRLEKVLRDHLPGILSGREDDEHLLPEPEAYIVSSLRETNHIIRGFQEQGAERIVLWVYRESPTQARNAFSDSEFSGDGDRHEAMLGTDYVVTVVKREEVASEVPTINGHKVSMRRHTERVADMYEKAVADVVLKEAVDQAAVSGIMMQSMGSTVAEIPEIGPASVSSVTFEVVQDVIVNSPRNS